jgi:hypothetical protein
MALQDVEKAGALARSRMEKSFSEERVVTAYLNCLPLK